MGEMAEGILNGDFDEVSGEYIGPGDGYPRTFTGTRSKGMEKYIEKTALRVVRDQRLPMADNRFIQDGFQIKFQGNKFTFFPKHCRMTWKGKWYDHNKGQEVEKILELTGFYSKPAPIEAKVNNVQKAIDHVLAKAEKIGAAKGADHATAMMLKTIAVELEQYL